MIENLITILVVAAIALLAARSLYRTLKGEKASCSCGSTGAGCGGCQKTQPLVEIQTKGTR